MSSRWVSKPPVGSMVNWSHPLSKGLVGCWLLNEGRGLQIKNIARNSSSQMTGGAWNKNSRGIVHSHTATSDYVILGSSSVLLPTKNFSAVFGYRKRDTTNRVSGVFGNIIILEQNTTRCGTHLPYSDGTVYWDFGGSSEGTTRLSKSGLTFGNDIWCLNTGSRGMEIWQNGIKRASNTANPTRVSGEENFSLGRHQDSIANPYSDVADYLFFYIFWRQLSPSEILSLYESPYQFVKGPTNITYFTAPQATGWTWGGEVKNVMVA